VLILYAALVWWSLSGSNRRPPACKAGALPAELRPQDTLGIMVGLGGLEPPASPLSGVRSNHLSYRPMRMNPRTRAKRPDSQFEAAVDEESVHGWAVLIYALRDRMSRKVQVSCVDVLREDSRRHFLKGGDPAAPSDTATLLRLHPSHGPLRGRRPPCGWASGFGFYQFSWCDGRCVQGPGTYSPRHS
jgi:hypothetical protein